VIGSLRGILVDRSPRGEVVVEVGGVGYRVWVTPSTLVALGRPGDEVLLYTHLQVREDSLTLYGFATREERDCFESLIAAHGVGPSLALAIISVHAPRDLRRVLVESDLDALTLVPGVGRKTAARLLVELKARLDVPLDDEAPANGAPSSRADVRAALAGLGYDPEEVRGVLDQLPVEGDVQDLLRAALRTLAANR
jgi:Holliday junction DNA helicase RuvA